MSNTYLKILHCLEIHQDDPGYTDLYQQLPEIDSKLLTEKSFELEKEGYLEIESRGPSAFSVGGKYYAFDSKRVLNAKITFKGLEYLKSN